MESKTCIHCGAELKRKPGESAFNFERRGACNATCAAHGRWQRSEQGRRAPDVKTCPVCGHEFHRRAGELKANWQRRKTCGIDCANRATSQMRTHTTPPKPCACCGKLMRRKVSEKPNEFDAREACNRSCRSTLINQRRAEHIRELTAYFVPLTKACEICGAFFMERDCASPGDFRKRTTCGRECGIVKRSQASMRPEIERACVECGAIVKRRPKEPPSTYAKRLTCSRACLSSLRSKLNQGVAKPQPRGYYALTWTEELRESIRERDGHQCVLCGTSTGRRKLAVHHLDYDKQNCRPSNLVTLCDPCHTKTNFNRERWRQLFEGLMAMRFAQEDANVA